MHEWSIAGAVVSSLIDFARREGVKKILEVEVAYGEVMDLDRDILAEAIRVLSRGSPLEGASILLREEEAKFRCNSCGAEWGMEEALSSISSEIGVLEEPGGIESPLHFLPDLAPALIKCPRCGSRDFELSSGKGVRVLRVVVER